MTNLLERALGLATELARHVAWYVRHQVQPSPRSRGD